MFETAELGREVTKADYDKREPKLRTRLLGLQERLRKEAKFPVLVLVNGVDGAGKGDAVNLLHAWMDPRYLRTFTAGHPTVDELGRPPFWRFWRDLPGHGGVGIYFGNWYTNPLLARVYKEIGPSALDTELLKIQAFERTLVDDGALLVKLWFHIAKAEQGRRFAALRADKRTRWRVTKLDLRNYAHYDRFEKVSERVLRETSTGQAPWTIIESTDRRYRDLAVGETLAAAVEERLERPASPVDKKVRGVPRAKGDDKTILDGVDLETKVSEKDYDERLEELQGRLNRAFHKLKRKKSRSVIAVFEGWDAAGKGGAIRRVTAALDARDYRVIPIAAPTEEEKARHYLWRFWRHLPGAGAMTVYDRSWYGRVLVERVEGFAREDEWQRAYSEINEFEEQLHDSGVVLAKLWLHIDADEQMKRFRERERTAFKRHKITRDDYRNRSKRPQYTSAVHDMVERTSTEIAPWHLVGANDKHAARLAVIAHLCERVESIL